MPTYSIARPSRLVRESATTMRYCGLRILPIRRSRIFTATVLFAPDDFIGEPGGTHVGIVGPEVSWTGIALRVRGRLTRAHTSAPFCQTPRRTHQSAPGETLKCSHAYTA